MRTIMKRRRRSRPKTAGTEEEEKTEQLEGMKRGRSKKGKKEYQMEMRTRKMGRGAWKGNT